jgi:Tfp pilus assembly protein PilV
MLNALLRPLAVAGLLTPALAFAQTPPLATPASAPCADQVVIELRVVSASGAAVGKLFEVKDTPSCCEAGCAQKPAKPKPAFLTAEQMKGWLEQVTADRSCTVMQAPKVTLDDGQSANVSVRDSAKFTTGLDVKLVDGNPVMVPKNETVELGTTLRVTGTLSADRKSVKLGLNYRHKELASPHVPLFPVTTYLIPRTADGKEEKDGKPTPFTQFIQQPTFRELSAETNVVVPDGRTVAVHAGKKLVQVRSEFGPPLVSQIPYLNRLFKNQGIGEAEQDVVVLATVKRLAAHSENVEVKPVSFTLHPVQVRPTPTRNQTVYLAPPASLAVRAATPADDVTALVSAYHAACAAGNKNEATRLAVQALAKDPTCFGRK